MEKIIIDGVDVAKCCYYDAKNDKGDWCDLTCTREHAPYFRCESMPNCYYKQLQRLKQENEMLNKMTGLFSARLCKKYKQALEEIRDLKISQGIYDDILKIINEVLDERD